MTPYRRNIAVGLTVLIGLIILGWMILQFGGRIVTPFTPDQILVRFITDRADGMSDGSPVQYRGVTVGRVTKVTRDPTSMTRIYIDATLDAYPPLPDNVEGRIRTQGLIGSGSALMLDTVPPGAPPQGTLHADKQIQAHFVGLDLIPPEFGAVATDVRETLRQFNEAKVIANFNDKLTRFGNLIDSANDLITDPKMRQDLRQSLANIRDVSESGKRVATNLDKTSANLDRLAADTRDAVVKASILLDQFQSIAGKIDNGQGTAGKLVGDPRLYESLVASSEELTLAIKDLRRLVQQWEQEGMSLKLK